MPQPGPDSAALGLALRALREERGVSQVELATAAGFKQSYVSSLENGQRNPSWNTVVRLARGLGIRVADLASRAEEAVG